MRVSSVVRVCFIVINMIYLSTSKSAYFWHITDFHYDPQFTSSGDIRYNCWPAKPNARFPFHPDYFKPGGIYGDYSCDSTYKLIQSAANFMSNKHIENVEYVLWTGDMVSSNIENFAERIEALRNATDILKRTFNVHFVYPVLGHNDPAPSMVLHDIFKLWLPNDALDTFKEGGYYIIEQTRSRLKIAVLNTNLMTSEGSRNKYAEIQWNWLESVMNKAVSKREMVFIVGHAPPGTDDSNVDSENHYTKEFTKRYIELIRRFHKFIAGQFFGHLHTDTFRLIYNEANKPISWAMVAPSLTPHKSSGPNNPGLRQFKFDTYSGKIFEYTQYYLDLTDANKGYDNWIVEYNLTQYYGINEITPDTLHQIAEQIKSIDEPIFKKYVRAHNLRLLDKDKELCDIACAYVHYCAITRIDYTQRNACITNAVNDTSSVSSLASNIWLLLIKLCVLIEFIV